MKVRIPKIGQGGMFNYKRQKFWIRGVEGIVYSDGSVKVDRFSTEGSGCNHLSGVKTELKWVDVNLDCPYPIGTEVYYLDTNPYRQHILKKGKVEAIQFNTTDFHTLFWYQVNGRKIDTYNIYKSLESFSIRTAPKDKLEDGEKYYFTKYGIQQNDLVAVKVRKITNTHSMYVGRRSWAGESKIRTCNLYNSHQSFINKMTAQVK